MVGEGLSVKYRSKVRYLKDKGGTGLEEALESDLSLLCGSIFEILVPPDDVDCKKVVEKATTMPLQILV